jgi:hypothetical protein
MTTTLPLLPLLPPDVLVLFANAPAVFVRKLAMQGECVVWTGALYPKGYGAFKLPKTRKTVRAHRVAYAWHYGSIPDPTSGIILMHACDVPSCVNPRHLSPGTRADNNRDMYKKQRNTHGDWHGHAKLTEAAVRDARTRHGQGELLTPMALEYGVSLPTLWYAVTRRTWKHVA